MNEPAASEPSTTAPERKEAPRPTFDLLPLSDEVRRALAEMTYVHPTPVQLAVWDPATRGKDAVVQARTGTGKTASFGLPIIDHILKRAVEGVQALVLCPTRELAVQVAAEIDRLGKYKGTKSIAIYGGASMERQVAALQEGAQLVVGTPGRVLDHIRRGTLRTSHIRLLVLDEADEMLSMGFERELTSIIEKLPPSRQTLLFSATVPPDIDRIARSRLKEPEFVTLSGDAVGALSIQHYTYLVPGDKVGALVQIIESENPESAIVFCNTRDQTETVASALQARGYDADWLNGDLPQSERESVMTRTRAGQLRFLVATDVAARGIDISHLTHVINCDFPQDAETYVHRTGRTGRAGRTGTAISLILPQDIGGLYLLRLTYKIRPIERVVPSATELKTRAEADVVTMLAEALLPRGTHEDDRALARRLLTHDQVEGILAGLLREYLGARPTAQADASDARRKTVRRATMRGRSESAAGPSSVTPISQAPKQLPEAALETVDAGGERQKRVEEEPRPAREPSRGRDRGPRERRDSVPGPSSDQPSFGGGRDDRGERRRDDRPRDDRPRDDRPRDDRPRDDRPREPRGERRSAEPISQASAPGPGAPVTGWHPPREEGDDEPLIPSRSGRGASQPREAGGRDNVERRPQGGGPRTATGSTTGPRPAPIVGQTESVVRESSADSTQSSKVTDEIPGTDDAAYVELFIGIGRRDGTRAQDILRTIVEDAAIDKDHIRRIRVRDRHAFVAIRKDQAEQAIARLNGKTLAGKASVLVELARERSTEDGTQEAPADS